MGKINLYWAEKFRELLKKHENEDVPVIAEYLRFCVQEEMALRKRFEDEDD